MYCSNCGAALGHGSRFCSGCGQARHVQPQGPPRGRDSGLTVTISSQALRLPPLDRWRGPAIGAAAAAASGIVLAAVANAALMAGVRAAPFSLAAAIGVLVYGSLGVTSSGGVNIPAESLLGVSGAHGHYSLSVTILGGFALMIGALVFAGWLSSRYGRVEERGSGRQAVKTALLFAALTFLGSFFVKYAGMSPEHVEALVLPLLFASLATAAGSRLERDGRGFWRAPIDAARARHGEVVQALGSGVDAVMCALKLSAAGTVIALAALAINYPHAAGKILGGRQLIAEVLLLPLYLPHLIGAMFLAAQGIAFRVGLTGTVGTIGALAGNHTSTSVSIFGGDGHHVPAYFLGTLLIPITTAVWGGYLAATRRAGSVKQRLRAALIASTPFVVLTWCVSALIGVTVQAGISALSGGLAFGTVVVDAIFWPLLWGPVGFVLGAGIQAWAAGDLISVLAGSDATKEPAQEQLRFCSQCGTDRGVGRRFCTSCGHAFVGTLPSPSSPISS
jgi:hypothetical protein